MGGLTLTCVANVNTAGQKVALRILSIGRWSFRSIAKVRRVVPLTVVTVTKLAFERDRRIYTPVNDFRVARTAYIYAYCSMTHKLK